VKKTEMLLGVGKNGRMFFHEEKAMKKEKFRNVQGVDNEQRKVFSFSLLYAMRIGKNRG
jgi:hypothetical protein